ncbi:MAG TPA: WD40 repeat domain-containing protein [Polyangiaceae bacterium]|nr:WD40 repeat domain-containing protein [Polyangiaceae bacterium]
MKAPTFAYAAIALALVACAKPPSLPPEPRAQVGAVSVQAADRVRDVDELIAGGHLRSAYAEVLSAAARSASGELDCRRARLALWLGAYSDAAESLVRLSHAKEARCDVAALGAEHRALSTSQKDEAGAQKLAERAARSSRERQYAAAKREYLRAWELAHPNGAWLIAAGGEAALAGTTNEARALFDRGMSELERETGDHFSVALPTNVERLAAVEWSPDGSLLALATPRSLVLVDSATLVERFVLPLGCNDLAWTAATGLICGHADGSVLRIDPRRETAVPLGKLPGPVRRVSANAGIVAAAGGGHAVFIDAQGSWSAADSGASAVAVSPDAKFGVTGFSDGSLRRVSLVTHDVERLRAPMADASPVDRVRISPDSNWIGASFGGDRAVVFELGRARRSRSLPFIGDFRFAPDSKALLTSSATFALEEVTSRRSLTEQLFSSSAFAISPDAESMFEQSAVAIGIRSRSAEHTVAERVTLELEGGWWFSLTELSEIAAHDGRFPASAARAPTPSIPDCNEGPGVRAPSSGELLCASGELRLTRPGETKPRWSVRLPVEPVGYLEFTADAQRVLVGGPRMRAAIVNVGDGSTAAELRLYALDFDRGDFSSTGSVIDRDGNVEFWGEQATELANQARCAVGTYRFDFAVCRDERSRRGTLAHVLGRR